MKYTAVTATIVLFLAMVIGGIYLSGSPQTVRQQKIDEQRVSDLDRVQWRIYDYYNAKTELPERIEQVKEANLSGDPYYAIIPVDPITGQPYGYERTGEKTFKLCATFFLPSEQNRPYYGSYGGGPYGPGYQITPNTWEHPAGYYCFERNIHWVAQPGLPGEKI